ncbi:MAG: PQQ-dependent sugar dehydrogenase [Anaerolineae bacterium]|nr:PQQ-dependent sugar dehydrogenase [Anaerolineae bacterium]
MPAVELREVARGFTAPIGLVSPDDETHRRFIVDQIGVIWILMPDDTLLETPFLDIQERLVELRTTRNDPRGLLSLVFHPGFVDNGRFFIFYTTPPHPDAPDGTQYTDVVAEMRIELADPNRADLASERIVIQFDHQTLEHSGGQLLFSPEGYLYIALGDDDRPAETAQNIESPFGGILRINVDEFSGDLAYSIPADNPFVDSDGLDELYAKGFRHPWRMSYDSEFGFLVSEPAWTFRASEINQIVSGGNYGWNIVPRTCYEVEIVVADCLQSAEGASLVPPVLEYDNDIGRIVIGGYVYRGSAIPELQGHYIFGEWGVEVQKGARIFAAQPVAQGRWQFTSLIERPFRGGITLWGFGQDAAGELYVMTMLGATLKGTSGIIYQLVPTNT